MAKMESGNTTPDETQEAVHKKLSSKAKSKGKNAITKKATLLERLKIQYVDIDSLKPNAYNPNRQSEQDFELLLKSMQLDGFTQPILVQKATKQIVDGEHRWRAAHELGMTQIPVVFVDMSAEQMRVSTLRHNRARGQEDIGLTSELLRDLEKLGAADWAQEELMMSDVEMEKLLEDIAAPEALAGDEYNEGWIPDASATDTVEGTNHDTADGQMTTATSYRALEKQREKERSLKAAHTEEEKQMIMKESDLFRVRLTFTDDEATLVKKALGKQPAERMVDMCD